MASAVSTPPSDPRHSTSSQPSQSSSATLHSAHDPHHRNDHADTSTTTSKRRKLLQRGGVDASASAAQHGGAETDNTRAHGLLGAELAERDRSRRRLPRRAGGFLLDAALPGSSSARRRSRETHAEEIEEAARSGSRHKSKSPSSHDGSHRAFSRGSSARSRPLSGDTDLALPSGNGHAPEEFGARTPENHKAQARPGLGIDVDGAHEYGENELSPANAGIDPAQIIHMALNLSESRRRNLGHGQLIAPSIPRSRRATSSGMGIPNTPMQGSFYDYGIGGSLKQHLQQQRRVSRNISPGGGRLSTSASRHVSISSPNAVLDNNLGPQHNYTFTAATLARAEKAKTYVELGAEYRRLLQHLPPLKPDSEASYTYSAFSSPGSPNVELRKTLSRTGPDPLGRRYNPLQFIRNRKLRARERRQLQPDVVDFEDVDRVKVWLDNVEKARFQQNYRQEDKVLLPPFIPDPMFQGSHEQPQDGKKPSILLGKQKRPRMDWFTLPTEFLADAAWLEQDNHKSLIEDRNGNRIFPSPRSTSLFNPRLSKDQGRPSMDRRRVSTAGSMAGGGPLSEPRSNYSSEAESHRGRKKRHFLHTHREDSPERGKRLGWISRNRSSSSSGLSSSDDDMSERRKKHDRRLSTQDENIGPLERHMKTLLEDDARAENGLSPIMSSPEKHWGANQGRPAPHRVMSETESDVDPRAGAKRATKRLTLMSSNPTESRPSMDGLDSSVPNTPLSKTFSFGASSPGSRVASPDRTKSKRSKLPFFRSEGSAKAHKVEALDFAPDPLSNKQPSGESIDPSRLSIDLPRRSNSLSRPALLKRHKTTDSLSSLASIQEGKVSRGRKEGKEPSSAVSRFFKDVGREGSKARKFIFKKDKPPEEADEDSSSDGEMSSTSDTDDDMSKSVVKRRPKPISRTGTDTGLSDASDVSDRRQGYALPTFKSAASQDQKRDPSTAPSETRRGRTRPSRFDRLAPPRLDTNVSRSSSPGALQVQHVSNGVRARSEGPVSHSHSRSPSAVRRRMTKLLELPGGAGRAGFPPSELSRLPVERKYSDRSPARPSPQRHWSITDEDTQRRASATHHPCAASIMANKRTDIARIQALLLCSGIKAAELARRAHTVPDTPPPFLLRVAEIAAETDDDADADPSNIEEIRKHTALIPTVARKEQHVLAARILASDLEAGAAALARAMDRFRAEQVRELHLRCERLRIELGDRLTPRCHACADDADAFTREVTSGATLAVKAVADRVDAMMRARRRRMRSFLIQVPMMAIASALAWFIILANIPESSTNSDQPTKDKLSRIDVAGSAALISTTLLLLLPLELGGKQVPWSHPLIYLLLTADVISGFLFAKAEARAKEPVLPLPLFHKPDFVLSSVVTVVQMAAQSSMMVTVPLYFQITGSGGAATATATEAGAHLVPAVLGNTVSQLLSGALIKRHGNYKAIITLGTTCTSVGYLLMLMRWNGSTGFWESLYIVPGEFGTGAASSALFIALSASLLQPLRAIGSSSIILSSSIGSVIGISLSPAMLQATLRYGLRTTTEIDVGNRDKFIRRCLETIEFVQKLDVRLKGVVVALF
ncbi:uncharacterized protein LTHEOB_724 [Lasiodiplodia theobromae]|uniref:uncharacterized protein n=1 Tax=Lasiodiplodia theobromae TaxID=45133 RepID=UPI0015C2D6E8|nr:uncharacterized protein LTHEOB_724 [Lasiodiplodia theobromae]KAF4540782.1 hypothetical protein LTHEOB_724 [Lasiodiplodia theobromae]